MSTSLLILALGAAALPGDRAAADRERPVLRSHSKSVTVIDGDHVKTNSWVLMPERNPDIYYVEIPRKPHTVTFRSDIAELSFPVSFGESIDFVILLDDGTSCATRIRAAYRKLQPFSREPETAEAEIPFTVGDNDKIYVRAHLNEGTELRFQFDLGSGGCLVKKGSVARANMRFDGTITLSNSDGVNQVPSSNTNHLQIGSLHWRDLPFAVADNMTSREDGLLGNILFQDKVVEIDYDRGVIAIHDAPPPIESSYSRHALILDGVVPYVRGSLAIGRERREGWFLFDTGAYTSILFTDTAAPWSKLLGELGKMLWWSDLSGPRLTIGEHAFAGFNYTVRNSARNDDQLGLLGNDILKRFNVVLDNQQGFVYLQPNSREDEPYANPEYWLARVIVVIVCLVLLGGLWIVRRQRSRSPKRESSP